MDYEMHQLTEEPSVSYWLARPDRLSRKSNGTLRPRAKNGAVRHHFVFLVTFEVISIVNLHLNHVRDMSIPVLDLSLADSKERGLLLDQLRDALFNVGFLYIKNHGVPQSTVLGLTDLLPSLFNLPIESRARLSKLNSPHFLGYSGFAEETTLGKKDLREQFDYATELPVVWQEQGDEDAKVDQPSGRQRRDFTKLYWRLRGPNQWPSEQELPGFREAFFKYAQSPSQR